MDRTLAALLTLLLITPATAQLVRDDPDADVAAALERIDAKRIHATLQALTGFGTRHALSTGDGKRGAAAASAWIRDELEESANASGGRMTTRFDDFDPRELARGDRAALSIKGIKSIRNVIAVLEGSEPERVVIVSGHYDSRVTQRYDTTSDAPGANDDGSGTAAVMELARALAPVKTRASIWFAALTAEELGLWGSRHLAKYCDENGIEVEAMITNDIIGCAPDDQGRRESDVVRIFSEGRPVARQGSNRRLQSLARVPSESDSPSRQLARYMADATRRYVPAMKPRLIFRQDRFLRGGDHRPFNLLGYAAIRMTEPRENYRMQHQDLREVDGVAYGDRLENVDCDYVTRVARINAAGLLSIARAPRAPRHVEIANRLSNATTLRWSGSDDETITYRVVLRRTHEPEWTVFRDAGSATTLGVPESKDDWVFAVQSVDAAGNRSLPTFAVPGRP